MKKIKLFLAAVAAMVSLGVNAQQEPANEGVYYLYNTANSKFLTRGRNWGTQAVTNDFGSPWKVYLADGKYTLRMYDIVTAEENTNRALGTNGFSDNNTANEHVAWTLSGDVNGYKLSYDDGGTTKYLCSPNNYGDNVIYTDANFNTTWQFLTVNEYKAILAAKTTAQESAIATSAGLSLGESTLTAIITNTNEWRSSDATSQVAAATPSNSTWTRAGVTNRGGKENEGNYGIERYEGGGTESYTVTGLSKGIYKVGVKAMFRSTSNAACHTIGEAGYVNSSAYFSANGNVVQIKDWYSSCTSNSAPNSTDAFVTIANNGGYYSEVYTYVGDAGTLELKAVSESFWGASWLLVNGVTLTYYSNTVSDEDIAALVATIPTRVSTAQATALTEAKNTLESEKTIANYNALAAAIAAAQTSANEYAIIDNGTVPTNAVAGWAKSTTNGELACNTWSNEGDSDGSGMTTPFIQDWVASGTALASGNADGKLYYTFTDLTPGETYVVTARVRVFNEAGTGVTGATYFVGANSKSIETFGAACTGDYETKGKFAVLSCAGTVDANGDLQFGVELDATSPINWISIKDVTIAEGTGNVPTAITLNKNSLSLTTGFTANLTATITPSSADDKTITWASSNTAVATVSGGNVVAVGPGNATITATAYAGSNVTATCAVTVADAAAPSYYSTTIAAEDYYIMNAATGMFLGGANSWGTQASLIDHGIPFTVSVGEGTYKLDSHTYNSENDHFVGANNNGDLYVDHAGTDLYITALGNGKFSISTANGSAFVTAAAGSTVVSNKAANTDSPLAQWFFLSKNDRDKMLSAATAQNPVDATYYVKQANISRNLSAGANNVNAWSQFDVGGTQDNTNFAAQVYNAAVDNYQTIENIPNGAYTVTVQAFTSGTDVKFYANDQKVNVQAKPDGVASCSAASALFAQGQYPNTVTVTVTDRTLKIGFEGDCSGAKWLCYDKVEVYMTGYTANTDVTATIDNASLEVGQTSQITAATTPATASFNAITYTSSDETIATVDENGVVTGVAVGNATITITANEMENFSKTIDVTVTYTSATAADYAALNAAIKAGEAKTIGFETGEFAPYNNADAIAALADAKAIDQNASNTQVAIQAATTALTSATWTANTEEVNGFYDGFFTIQTVPSTNTRPLGWTRHSATANSNDGTDGGYETRLMSLPTGVTESNKGMMTKFHAFYGDQEGFTLPLKAETYYTLSFKYAGWGNTPTMHVNVYNSEGSRIAQSGNFSSQKGDTDASKWDEYSYTFKTTTAGNYVIGLIKNTGGTEQNQAGFTDIELKRVPALALNEATAWTPTAYKAANVTLTRSFNSNWATFVVPFDIDNATLKAQFGDDVQVSTISASDNTGLTFSAMDTPAITANEPVIMKVSNTNGSYTFDNVEVKNAPATKELVTGVSVIGNYAGQITMPTTTNEDTNTYYYIASNKMKYTTGTQTLKGFRAYFSVAADASTSVKAFFESFNAGAEDAINGIEAETENAEIYNLAGQRVNKTQKGIYIINGKKVLVK